FEHLHSSVREVVHERQVLEETLEKTYKDNVAKFEKEGKTLEKAMEEKIREFRQCEDQMVEVLKRSMDERVLESDKKVDARVQQFRDKADGIIDGMKPSMEKAVEDKLNSTAAEVTEQFKKDF